MTNSVQPAAQPLVLVDPDRGEVAFCHGGRSPEEVRSEITRIANSMLALPDQDKTEMPVDHQFLDGMYIRRLFIPRGTLLVGKIHKQACINFVESGDISILTEFGSKRVGPGSLAISGEGIQKLGYAHQDTVFVNVFRTDETDINKIEADIACESYEMLERQGETECLSHS